MARAQVRISTEVVISRATEGAPSAGALADAADVDDVIYGQTSDQTALVKVRPENLILGTRQTPTTVVWYVLAEPARGACSLAHVLTCSRAHVLTCSRAHVLTCSRAHVLRPIG